MGSACSCRWSWAQPHLVLNHFALLAEDGQQGLIAGTVGHARLVGEVLDHPEQVFGCLLSRALPLLGVAGIANELRLGQFVTPTQAIGESRIGVGIMTLDLHQEPLDGHRHQLGAAEGRHEAIQVGESNRWRETSCSSFSINVAVMFSKTSLARSSSRKSCR